MLFMHSSSKVCVFSSRLKLPTWYMNMIALVRGNCRAFPGSISSELQEEEDKIKRKTFHNRYIYVHMYVKTSCCGSQGEGAAALGPLSQLRLVGAPCGVSCLSASWFLTWRRPRLSRRRSCAPVRTPSSTSARLRIAPGTSPMRRAPRFPLQHSRGGIRNLRSTSF